MSPRSYIALRAYVRLAPIAAKLESSEPWFEAIAHLESRCRECEVMEKDERGRRRGHQGWCKSA